MAWSAHNEQIFYTYKYNLGMGKLSGIDYSRLKVNIVDANFYNVNKSRIIGVYPSSTLSEEKIDYNNLRLKDLSADLTIKREDKREVRQTRIIPTNLYISSFGLTSFNDDTGMTNTSSYENMLDNPASSKIFSDKVENNNNSWVTGDFDWIPSTYSEFKNVEAYFHNEYNFSEGYDNREYYSYGLNEHKIVENTIKLSAADFNMDSSTKLVNTSAMNFGAGGIVLSYNDGNVYTDENEMPVAFYDFGKTLYSNFNSLNIQWHEDGIIKVV